MPITQRMKKQWKTILVSCLLFVSVTGFTHDSERITLIQLSDVHGNLIPHAGVIKNLDGSERIVTRGGGVAKLKTLVNRIREDNPNSLLLSVGDSVHGTPEVLFTVGDAIMPALNAFGIDAYTPGNWEFGYGPAVFRHRFTSFGPKPPLPANIRVMSDVYGGPGVTAATFPSLAINLYNAAPLPAQLQGKRVLAPYKIFTVKNTKVAVIGITASIVPQQAAVFNIGLRFTQGTEELPGIIKQVKALGADVVVVQSELGLAQNLQIAKEFRGIDVVLSAHTHETTLGAFLVRKNKIIKVNPGQESSSEVKSMLARGATIVAESGEDLYLGRLDLKIRDSQIRSFKWQAIPADDDVPEDPAMKAIVDHAEEPFIKGKDGVVQVHSFLPGGFCPGGNCGDIRSRGLQLVDDLDTVVGKTDVILERNNMLEDVMNNFLADAIRNVTDPVVAGQSDWSGVDISMTNGFRFDTTILPASAVPAGKTFQDGRNPGEITLRDLYTYYPIAPAVIVADFSGRSIVRSLEDILAHVFHRNPYLQRGGWYVGLSNMEQKIDLKNRPFSSSSGRIVETKVAGQLLDPSKRYVFSSCYGHGNPLDTVCRTGGGAGFKFFELADAANYSSALSLVEPVNKEKIQVGPRIKQVAPNRYLHPVHIMRRYLDSLPNQMITQAQFSVGRVQTVDSTIPGNPPIEAPKSAIDPSLIQPIEGAGPGFLDRLWSLFKTK